MVHGVASAEFDHAPELGQDKWKLLLGVYFGFADNKALSAY
jgi:hypothetical protein